MLTHLYNVYVIARRPISIPEEGMYLLSHLNDIPGGSIY